MGNSLKTVGQVTEESRQEKKNKEEKNVAKAAAKPVAVADAGAEQFDASKLSVSEVYSVLENSKGFRQGWDMLLGNKPSMGSPYSNDSMPSRELVRDLVENGECRLAVRKDVDKGKLWFPVVMKMPEIGVVTDGGRTALAVKNVTIVPDVNGLDAKKLAGEVIINDAERLAFKNFMIPKRPIPGFALSAEEQNYNDMSAGLLTLLTESFGIDRDKIDVKKVTEGIVKGGKDEGEARVIAEDLVRKNLDEFIDKHPVLVSSLMGLFKKDKDYKYSPQITADGRPVLKDEKYAVAYFPAVRRGAEDSFEKGGVKFDVSLANQIVVKVEKGAFKLEKVNYPLNNLVYLYRQYEKKVDGKPTKAVALYPKFLSSGEMAELKEYGVLQKNYPYNDKGDVMTYLLQSKPSDKFSAVEAILVSNLVLGKARETVCPDLPVLENGALDTKRTTKKVTLNERVQGEDGKMTTKGVSMKASQAYDLLCGKPVEIDGVYKRIAVDKYGKEISGVRLLPCTSEGKVKVEKKESQSQGQSQSQSNTLHR